MKDRTWVLIYSVLLASNLVGCRHHSASTASQISRDNPYIDLRAGWRLRVVTPVLESGGYQVKTEQVRSEDGTIHLQTEKGFRGYQTDYYSVNPASAGKLTVSFERGEFSGVDQKKVAKNSPAIVLFTAESGRFVRLLYLTRVSETDHDEAVLSAPSAAELESLTTKLEASPSENCRKQVDGNCAWIPAGIAVQVEKKSQNGKEWVPVL